MLILSPCRKRSPFGPQNLTLSNVKRRNFGAQRSDYGRASCARPPALEMSEPTYRELATNFDLWCKFVLLEEQVSEREFNEMSIDERLDILQGCFGHEIRALSPPRPQPPSRLG
jgi:hypothetical protein